MITFKPEVFAHQKRRDGTYNVKIRVTFNRKVKRLPTTLYCTQADLTKSCKIKSGDIITKANDLCARMRAACSDLTIFELENRDIDWVIAHIRAALTGETFRLDFFEWADTFLKTKGEGNRTTYVTALNSFARFLGKRQLDINEITHTMLTEYLEHLDTTGRVHVSYKTKEATICAKGKTTGASSALYIQRLGHIFKAAKNRYNDEDSGRILIPRSPFDKVRRPFPPSEGQKNIGADIMRRVMEAQTDDTPTRIALDVFCLSFMLMGANLADLYNAIPFRGETWVYNRQKTAARRSDHAEMRVRIPAEARPFISRLNSHKGAWWLPSLHYLAPDKDRCTARVNRCLKRWCEANGVPVFTFYAARHTWASLARKAGVEKATIDECLCHIGDYDMADIYAERDWDIINQANARVLELFR